MDFSNYPPEHDNYNKDKHLMPGFFKDENGGIPIEEFCGLRAKMYSVKSPNHVKKAAKGVSGKQSHLNSYSYFII